MLREKGLSALNLQPCERVYRTEYSVLGHTKLLEKVTGIDLSHDPTDETRKKAEALFCEAWDICLNWNIRISARYLEPYVSKMGHAVYAENGADQSDVIYECFKDEDEVFSFDPLCQLPYREIAAIRSDFDADYDAQCARFPDQVTMTGIYVTCMSGLIDMLGWNMLLTCAGSDAERFGRFTERYTQWIERYFLALAQSKAPVVMIHDDIVWTEGAFMQPEWYRRFVFPAYRRCFAPLHDAGKKILFTSDGNYSAFIDDIASCGVNCFVLEPCTDMAYIAEKYGRTHSFIGNADTRVLLLGDREDVRREVRRCMDIGKNCPGFIMAVGNHIPANTPVDNCLYYDEFCKQYGRR